MARQRLEPSVRRELILDAAGRAFGRLGYEATRVEDIAEEAGIAKGLPYRHFATKEDLFRALMARRGEHCAVGLRQRLADAVARGSDTAALLRVGLEGWIGLIIDEVAAGTWVSDLSYEEGASLYHDQIREVIVDSIVAAQPHVPIDVAWLVASALDGAGESAILAWANGRATGVSHGELVEILVGFCSAGLQASLALSHADRR